MNPVRELLRAGGEGIAELWLAEGSTRGAAFAELERLRARRGREGPHGAAAEARPARRDRPPPGGGRGGGRLPVRRGGTSCSRRRRRAAGRRSSSCSTGSRTPTTSGQSSGPPTPSARMAWSSRKDRAVGVTPAVAKASAGAVERCPVARVTNVAKTVEALKECGDLVRRAGGRWRPAARARWTCRPHRARARERGGGAPATGAADLRLVRAYPHGGGAGQPLGLRLGGGGALRGGAAARGGGRGARFAGRTGRLTRSGPSSIKTPLHRGPAESFARAGRGAPVRRFPKGFRWRSSAGRAAAL